MLDHATPVDRPIARDARARRPLAVVVLAVLLACAVAALVVQAFHARGLQRKLDDALERSEFSAAASVRDGWTCGVLRGERYVVCELPPHGLRIEAFMNIHRGCC